MQKDSSKKIPALVKEKLYALYGGKDLAKKKEKEGTTKKGVDRYNEFSPLYNVGSAGPEEWQAMIEFVSACR